MHKPSMLDQQGVYAQQPTSHTQNGPCALKVYAGHKGKMICVLMSQR